MKSIYLVLTLFLALFVSSCSSDSSSGNNPFVPGGGGGTGNVTFTTTLVQDPNTNVYYFQFAPSTSVTVVKITANCAAAGVTNAEITGDGTTVYTQQSPPQVSTEGVTLAVGQAWTFKIEGKVGSSTGEAYTSNTSYTIQ